MRALAPSFFWLPANPVFSMVAQIVTGTGNACLDRRFLERRCGYDLPIF